MKYFEVRYLNYEGNTASKTVEMPDDADEESAISHAIETDCGWGDGIHRIIDCNEVGPEQHQ